MSLVFARPVRAFALSLGFGVLVALLGGGATSADVTPELQKQINAAIDRGQTWLKAQRASDGSYPPVMISGSPGHQVGVTSLCGLALLAAGESKKDPGMLKMLEWLKAYDSNEAHFGRAATSTYGAGCLLMFLTEMFRPEEKPDKDKGRYAKAKPKDPCGLPKEMREWVEELARWLASVQMEDGWWRYPATPPSDLSNTQYALLGLRAAHDCGAQVPMLAIMKALEGTLAAQEKDGPKVRRLIPGGGKPGDTDYAVDSGDKARGWKYQRLDGIAATGSMTTAGISALAICRDILMKEKYTGYTDELERKVSRSVQDGFAWLDAKFAVDKNPPPGSPAWHYYYLYGLERACMFGGRDRIGKHDWYAEGAQVLVGAQKGDGRWSTGALGASELAPSDLCDTAWALLFLKRATRPMIPIKAPVVTSGG